jgi:dsDNA-binding SOS-regulon protein
MTDGADFRQQEELEERQQWLAENKDKFNEIFGGIENEQSNSRKNN